MTEPNNLDGALAIGQATDPGRTGKNNEDYLGFFEVNLEGAAGSGRAQIAVVCDGIGGNNAGEVASKVAVETIQNHMVAHPSIPVRQRLEEAIIAANRAVFEAAADRTDTRGMGTTVVAMALTGQSLVVAHAGDSRAYLVRAGQAYRLTLDHTWAQEAIDHGVLTPEAARVHPNRNVIKRYLGVDDTVEVDLDLLDVAQPAAQGAGLERALLESMTLQPGDLVLLCSDGLTDEITDAELESIVQRFPPQQAAEELVALANAHGGRDNITVILLQLPGGIAPVAAAMPVERSRVPLMIAALVLIVALAALLAFLLTRPPSGGDQSDAPGGLDTAPAAVASSTIATPPGVATDLPLAAATEVAPDGAQPASGSRIPRETQAPEAEATATPMPVATSTAVSTHTATPTDTPRAAPTATATTGAIFPIQSPETSGSDLRVTLLRPAADQSGNGTQLFVWRIDTGELAEGQAFEVRFWKPGQDPLTDSIPLERETVENRQVINLDIADAASDSFEPGQLSWGVVLVQRDPFRLLRLVSDERLFRYELPAPAATPTAIP